LGFLFQTNPTQAQVYPTVEVTPAIIDEKAMARDILKYSIKIKNVSDRKLDVYTFVNNISQEEGRQEFIDPSRADKEVSLANWIQISRSNNGLLEGEEKTLDLTINVNLRAKPGKYHAVITFSEGSNRDEAESKIAGAPKVLVNLDVIEDIKEIVELDKFVPEKKFFTGSLANFNFTLSNTGNRELTPSAELRIYDRRGAEIASIDANPDGDPISPGQTVEWQAEWTDIKKFGQYKANLLINYGTIDIDRLQDQVFFYVIPKSVMVIIGIIVIVLVILISLATFYLPRKYEPPAFLPDAVENFYEHLPWHHHHTRLQELYEKHNHFADTLVELEEHLPRGGKHPKIKELHEHHWELSEELADLTDELAEHLPWHLMEDEEETIKEKKYKSAGKKSIKKLTSKKTKTKNTTKGNAKKTRK
jgi:hypothetical protein